MLDTRVMEPVRKVTRDEFVPLDMQSATIENGTAHRLRPDHYPVLYRIIEVGTGDYPKAGAAACLRATHSL